MRMIYLIAQSAGTTDWVARGLAIGGFIINFVGLCITFLRGRRVRALLLPTVHKGEPLVEMRIIAKGTFPVSVTHWGFRLNKRKYRLPSKRYDIWPYGTGPHGPSKLPVVVPAGEELRLGTTFAHLEKQMRDDNVAENYIWICGYVRIATRRLIVKTRKMRLNDVRNEFNNNPPSPVN